MSKSKSRPDVDSLLAERARFEAWLDQLLAKASKVPAHVVERVRGDYEARLAKVVEELRSRADELREETGSLETRLARLEEELSGLQDARAEDELRAMVGEYDEESWRVKSAEHDGGIHRVEADRDRGQAELTRVRELLSETTRPSRAMRAIDDASIPDEPTPVESGEAVVEEDAPLVGDAEPAAEVAAAELSPRETEPDPPRVSAAPPLAPEVPTTRNPSPFDEIGFLRTVVGRATPFAGVETSSVLRASVADVAPPPSVAASEAPAPALVAPAPPVAVAAPVAPTTPPPAPPSPPPAEPAPIVAARVSARAMPSFDEPMLAEPVAPVVDPEAEARAAEAARTLKCQECGWMNYPTEWYCEKCGGELAAF